MHELGFYSECAAHGEKLELHYLHYAISQQHNEECLHQCVSAPELEIMCLQAQNGVECTWIDFVKTNCWLNKWFWSQIHIFLCSLNTVLTWHYIQGILINSCKSFNVCDKIGFRFPLCFLRDLIIRLRHSRTWRPKSVFINGPEMEYDKWKQRSVQDDETEPELVANPSVEGSGRGWGRAYRRQETDADWGIAALALIAQSAQRNVIWAN